MPNVSLPPAVEVDPRHNLAEQLTSFIGREHEIEALASLMDTNRMVTLLGVGGAGKTRLALQMARLALPKRNDGVWLVELAPVEDEPGAVQAVAAALGIRAGLDADPLATVTAGVGRRRVLLVVDNCEHLVGPVARICATLLRGCPGLSVLATSREALGVPGEVTFHVPSLTVPAPEVTVPEIEAAEAVRLFSDRARRARPSFTLSDENAPAVSGICRQLDGIPLAIELAAARVRVLSPEQICTGLADRFALLTGGGRTVSPRQQTLRASVDWSYELLTGPERLALARLSVFSGGFDLDAAVDVLVAPPIQTGDVLDVVTSLVDKSLVVADDRGTAVRFRQLETIRQYSHERLVAAAEDGIAAQRHRQHYRQLLEQAADEEEGLDQQVWRERVEAELDNVRAALHSAERDGDGECLLALTVGAGNTWTLVGRTGEHRRWLETALQVADASSPLRANALYQLGVTDGLQGNTAGSVEHIGASIPLYRAQGDHSGALWASAEYVSSLVMGTNLSVGRPVYEAAVAEAEQRGEAGALYALRFTWASLHADAGLFASAQELFDDLVAHPGPVEHYARWARIYSSYPLAQLGQLDRAVEQATSVLDHARQGDTMTVALGAWILPAVLLFAGRLDAARDAAEEIAGEVAVGMDTWLFSNCPFSHMLGLTALAVGEVDEAVLLLAEATATVRSISSLWWPWFCASQAQALLASGLLDRAREVAAAAVDGAEAGGLLGHAVAARLVLARISLARGQEGLAKETALEVLNEARTLGMVPAVIEALELIGVVHALGGRPAETARVLGAAEGLRAGCGYRLRWPHHCGDYDEALDAARDQLGDEFAAAWAQGLDLDLDAACDWVTRGRGQRGRPSQGWSALTPTEKKVADLVANGLTNVQVGERLFVSRHTVDSHLRHIFAKLDITSRAQLAAISRDPAARDGVDA